MPNYEVIRLGGAMPMAVPEYGVLCAAILPPGLDGKQYAVRPIKDLKWRDRERMRFEDGTYKQPPWPAWVLRELETNCPDHFLHVSTKDPTKVSFTETPEKGEVDRQCAPMSPGRYLERYARSYRTWQEREMLKVPPEDGTPWLDAQQIRSYGAMLLPPNALAFATTPEEIVSVYENGPSSCMAGDEFSSSVHPCHVYGAGDLAVAYLKVDSGVIIARALCWPAKKVYGRVYGDEHRLKQALKAEGYSFGSLAGAKMLRILENGAYVMPYIDRHGHFEDCGEHLIISNSGIDGQSTNGLAEDGDGCEACGDFVSRDEAHHFHDTTYCESCYNDRTFYCEGYDEAYHNDDYFGHVEGVGAVSDAYYENNCYTCDKTGRHYVTDDAPPITMADGETWCPAAFDQYGGTCERTDEHYHVDDLVGLADTGELVSIAWADQHAHAADDGTYYAEEPEQLEEAA